jgi:hypothetical protein
MFNATTKERQVKATMTRDNESFEVTLEPMPYHPGEYSVYPFCVAKSALEELGFKFTAAA